MNALNISERTMNPLGTGSPARDIRQRLAPLPPAAWASSSSGISSNHARYGLMMQDFLSVPIPAGWRASCSGKPAAALYYSAAAVLQLLS